jgi:mannan endo-1,4-beta-mannosidase
MASESGSRPGRLIVMAVAFSFVVASCGASHTTGQARPRASSGSRSPVHTRRPERPIPVDIAPYLRSGGKLYLGVSESHSPPDMAAVSHLGRLMGRQPDLLLYFQSWTVPFKARFARDAWNAHMLPVLTWQPWAAADGDTAYFQPAWTLRQILSGRYDAYIRRTAEAIGQLGFPIGIRLAHEMNGFWYPWGVASAGSGNTPAEYVAMWRHVWTIFHRVGVTNVIWVWSPNVVSGVPAITLRSVYPGTRYVDWVGLSGYLSGSIHTFAEEYAGTLAQLDEIAPDKPWVITETGASGGDGATQAQEMSQLFDGVIDNRHFAGITYFDEATSRADWQFQGEPASLAAVRAAVSDPRFDYHLPQG